MQPGTYAIVNLEHGTAIIENVMGIVGWHGIDFVNQQWFVQCSGEGYRFKNVSSGCYLAIASTVDQNCDLYCSGYPTTWALVPNPEHRGHGLYGIMMGDTDRILDLSDGNDGTKIYAFSHSLHKGSTKHRVWRFERISDDTGEESPTLAQNRGADSRVDELIKSQASEITFLRQLVQDSRQGGTENHPRISQLAQEVTRLSSEVGRLEALINQRPGNNAT